MRASPNEGNHKHRQTLHSHDLLGSYYFQGLRRVELRRASKPFLTIPNEGRLRSEVATPSHASSPCGRPSPGGRTREGIHILPVDFPHESLD